MILWYMFLSFHMIIDAWFRCCSSHLIFYSTDLWYRYFMCTSFRKFTYLSMTYHLGPSLTNAATICNTLQWLSKTCERRLCSLLQPIAICFIWFKVWCNNCHNHVCCFTFLQQTLARWVFFFCDTFLIFTSLKHTVKSMLHSHRMCSQEMHKSLQMTVNHGK